MIVWWCWLWVLLGTQQDQDRTLERYRAALLRTPQRGTALDRYVHWYVDRGRTEDLLPETERALAGDDATARHLILGLLSNATGNNQRAATEFERARRAEPDDPRPHLELGRLHQQARRWGPASDSFVRAIQRGLPEAFEADVRRDLARCFFRTQRVGAACAALAPLWQTQPVDRFELQQVAELLSEEAPPELARDAWKQLYTLSSDQPDLRLTAGLELATTLELDDPDDALALLQELREDLLAESWQARRVRDRITRLLLRRGDDALLEHDRARVAARPNDAAALRDAAHSLLDVGEVDEAVAHLEQLVALRPNATADRVRWIEALDAAGRTGDAAREARRLADLEPDVLAHWERWGRLRLQGWMDAPNDAPWPPVQDDLIDATTRLAQAGRGDADAAGRAIDVAQRWLAQTRLARIDGRTFDVEPLTEAIRPLFARTAEADPVTAALERGAFEWDQGHRDAAHAAWKPLLDPPLLSARGLQQLARQHKLLGTRVARAPLLAQAVTLAPNDLPLHRDWLRALAVEEDIASAAAAAATVRERWIDTRPETFEPGAWLNLCTSLRILDAEHSSLAQRVVDGLADPVEMRLLAEFERRRGDLAASAELLEAAWNAAPSLDVALALSEVLEGQDAVDDAVQRLEDAATRWPRAANEAWQRAAEILVARRQWDDAVRILQRRLDAGTLDTASELLWASIEFAREQSGSGLTILRRAVTRAPRSIEARDELARRVANDHPDEARTQWWRCVALESDETSRRDFMAKILSLDDSPKDYARTLTHLQRVAARTPSEQRTLTLCRVDVLAASGQLDEAGRTLDRLLRREPQNETLLRARVRFARDTDDADTALVLQKRLAQVTSDRNELRTLAQLALDFNRIDDAIAAWTEVLRTHPDERDVADEVDRILERAQPQHAMALSLAALEVAPGLVGLRVRAAQLALRADQRALAAEHFRLAAASLERINVHSAPIPREAPLRLRMTALPSSGRASLKGDKVGTLGVVISRADASATAPGSPPSVATEAWPAPWGEGPVRSPAWWSHLHDISRPESEPPTWVELGEAPRRDAALTLIAAWFAETLTDATRAALKGKPSSAPPVSTEMPLLIGRDIEAARHDLPRLQTLALASLFLGQQDHAKQAADLANTLAPDDDFVAAVHLWGLRLGWWNDAVLASYDHWVRLDPASEANLFATLMTALASADDPTSRNSLWDHVNERASDTQLLLRLFEFGPTSKRRAVAHRRLEARSRLPEHRPEMELVTMHLATSKDERWPQALRWLALFLQAPSSVDRPDLHGDVALPWNANSILAFTPQAPLPTNSVSAPMLAALHTIGERQGFQKTRDALDALIIETRSFDRRGLAYARGCLRWWEGQRYDALTSWRRLVVSFPEDRTLQAAVAGAHHAMGDADAARLWFERSGLRPDTLETLQRDRWNHGVEARADALADSAWPLRFEAVWPTASRVPRRRATSLFDAYRRTTSRRASSLDHVIRHLAAEERSPAVLSPVGGTTDASHAHRSEELTHLLFSLRSGSPGALDAALAWSDRAWKPDPLTLSTAEPLHWWLVRSLLHQAPGHPSVQGHAGFLLDTFASMEDLAAYREVLLAWWSSASRANLDLDLVFRHALNATSVLANHRSAEAFDAFQRVVLSLPRDAIVDATPVVLGELARQVERRSPQPKWAEVVRQLDHVHRALQIPMSNAALAAWERILWCYGDEAGPRPVGWERRAFGTPTVPTLFLRRLAEQGALDGALERWEAVPASAIHREAWLNRAQEAAASR